MLGNLLSVVTIDILSSWFWGGVLVNYELKGRDRAEVSRDFAALVLGIGSLHINTRCLPPPPSFLLLLNSVSLVHSSTVWVCDKERESNHMEEKS